MAAVEHQQKAEQRSASTNDLLAMEPTQPGLWRQRKREVRELEEEAGAPGAREGGRLPDSSPMTATACVHQGPLPARLLAPPPQSAQ